MRFSSPSFSPTGRAGWGRCWIADHDNITAFYNLKAPPIVGVGFGVVGVVAESLWCGSIDYDWMNGNPEVWKTSLVLVLPQNIFGPLTTPRDYDREIAGRSFCAFATFLKERHEFFVVIGTFAQKDVFRFFNSIKVHYQFGMGVRRNFVGVPEYESARADLRNVVPLAVYDQVDFDGSGVSVRPLLSHAKVILQERVVESGIEGSLRHDSRVGY
jgi:hypothetical protein